jgi:hypothetical protein
VPFALLKSFQASTSPTGPSGRPEGRTVQRDGAPRRISRPYSTFGTEDLMPGASNFPQPYRAREVWLPPRRVAVHLASRPYYRSERSWDCTLQSLFLRAEPHPVSRAVAFPLFLVHPPPEIQMYAAASRLCSPLEYDTHRRFFRPLAGRCSRGLLPLQRYSPPRTGNPSIQPSCPWAA